MAERMTKHLRRMYRQRTLTPVIIQSENPRFEDVKAMVRQIIPTERLTMRTRLAPGYLSAMIPIEIGLSPLKQMPLFNMVACPLTPNLIEEVAQWREVETVYPDRFTWALQTVPPGGVFENAQKKTFTSTWWTKKVIGADRANEQGFDGRGVNAVVIDTGSRKSHRQLTGVRTLTAMPEKGGSGSDSNGHGSWCCSCVGGKYQIDRRYNVPVEGMAPGCNLISIQALGFVVGMGSTSDVIKAMEMSIGLDADVVSMSLGSTEAPADDENPEAIAVRKMVDANIIPIIAAGNAGPDPETIGSPGSVREALTVGAWDAINGELANFSSRGPTSEDRYIKPDVIAPGVRIDSALVGYLDGAVDPSQVKYGPISGTSMATPHVAGLVACARQMFRERAGVTLTVDMIKDMMSRLGPNQPKDNDMGWGIITFEMFERYLEEVMAPPAPPEEIPPVAPPEEVPPEEEAEVHLH